MADEQPPTQRDFTYLSTAMHALTATLDQLRQEMKDTYVRKDVLGPTLDTIRNDVSEVRRDVDELIDWKTWVLRLVVGFVVLALLGAVIYAGGGKL